MRLLVVTNMYPTQALPAAGTFVADQVRSLRTIGLETDVLVLDRTGRGRRVYRGLARRTRERVAAWRPDVVHVMYGGVMADVVARVVRDRPVVVSFCGDDLQGNAGNGLVSALTGRYGVVASARAAHRAACIIVKSRNLFEALPKSIDLTRVRIVPNGVDLLRFKPLDRAECRQKLGWHGGRAHVLFPAPRSRGEKRFALADAGVRLLHRGGVDVELHTLDAVPHDDVPVWLNASDAIVLTSMREGSPNVVKEALACNVPVVSVDVGDVRERLAGIQGCYIAAATELDVMDKLSRALERRERVAGRERMAELSLERVAERLREIYAALTTSQ